MDKVLLSRNIDVKSLSKEDFVNLLYEDFLKAVENHKDILNAAWGASRDKRMLKVRAAAYKYAEAKWKRESRKSSYIETEVNKEFWKEYPAYWVVSYFDFDTNFGRENYTVSINTGEEYSIKGSINRIYEKLHENEYNLKFFNAAEGWEFIIDEKEDKLGYYGRPYIQFILSDELNKEIEANRKKLADAINNFYKDCKYWGD